MEEASTPSGQNTAIPIEPTEAETEITLDETEVESSEEVSASESDVGASESEAGERGGPVTFQISQDDSEVQFLIDEILRGESATAVGSTNQIVGEITIDIANPAETQIGVIQINARTLETGEFRQE